MRVLESLLFASVAAAAIVTSAAAATLVPVPGVPNAKKTTAYAINDNNVIAGSYIGQDRVEHAFFGTLDGHYTTFDASRTGTVARGINNAGIIAGFANSQNGITSEEVPFIRKPGGKRVFVPGIRGRAAGINNNNQFAGTFWDFTDFEAVAYVGHNAQFRHEVLIPSVHQASDGEGINDNGDVVGSFFRPPDHGFIVSNRTLTTVDYPSSRSTGTALEAIDNSGQAVGQWVGTKGRVRSFLFDSATDTFTDIEVPGARKIEAWGINNNGVVAVSTNIGSFLWCAVDTACPAPGAHVNAPVHMTPKPLAQLRK